MIIGIMGSASGPLVNDSNISKARELGKCIAKSGHNLLSGATTGLPMHASIACQENGGKTIGISPAKDRAEHIEIYKKPVDPYDEIEFTGLGYNGRNRINIVRSDALIFIGGSMGTLNEFTTAFDAMKPIGVFTGTGGFSDHFKEIVKIADKDDVPNIIYSSDPQKLIEQIQKL